MEMAMGGGKCPGTGRRVGKAGFSIAVLRGVSPIGAVGALWHFVAKVIVIEFFGRDIRGRPARGQPKWSTEAEWSILNPQAEFGTYSRSPNRANEGLEVAKS
jgi:hypothetical protein